jgi:hypothetical protein
MSKKKTIGLQNRLEIVIQAALDYEEEGGQVSFAILNDTLLVEIEGVGESDGRLWVQADEPAMNSTSAIQEKKNKGK